jgi:DnaJ-class molecular chaperone
LSAQATRTTQAPRSNAEGNGNTTLKVKGKGNEGTEGSGDLYVILSVAEHILFRRRGADLLCEAPISLVVTLTTGSSMRGYSRVASLVNDTAPSSTSISDSTVANTGRRIEISDSFIVGSDLFVDGGCATLMPGNE